MRLAVSTAAVLLLAAGPAAAATPCHRPTGATTVLASSIAAVFTSPLTEPENARDGQRYWGCARSEGRLRKLYDTHTVDVDGESSAGQFRLAGHFVASVNTVTDHYGGSTRRIVVNDLTRRTVDRTSAYGMGNLSTANGPVFSVAVLRLKLDAAGAVAWLQRSPDIYGKNTTDRLVTIDRAGNGRSLDSAAPGQITTIHLSGHRLTWRQAGAPRSARLAVAAARP
jgi:hypothetical protein